MASGMVLKCIEKLLEAFSGDWDIGRANGALRENLKTLAFHPKRGLLSIQWHDGTWAVDGIPLHLRRSPFSTIEGGYEAP